MSLTSKDSLIINGVEYNFQSVKVTFESLATEDSGRNEAGYMNITYVRPKLVKLQVTLPAITSAQLASKWQPLLNYVQGNPSYSVTYFDMLTNAERTMTAYTSNQEASVYNGVLYNGVWQGIQFSIIEV